MCRAWVRTEQRRKYVKETQAAEDCVEDLKELDCLRGGGPEVIRLKDGGCKLRIELIRRLTLKEVRLLSVAPRRKGL